MKKRIFQMIRDRALARFGNVQAFSDAVEGMHYHNVRRALKEEKTSVDALFLILEALNLDIVDKERVSTIACNIIKARDKSMAQYSESTNSDFKSIEYGKAQAYNDCAELITNNF